MGLTKIRSKLDEYQRDRKGSQQSQSQYRKQSTESTLSRKQSTDSTLSGDSNNSKHDTVRPLSDAKMLERAREAHMKVDFGSLASGPKWGGPWQRVESADQFVVFRGQAASSSKCTENGVEVMCAGELEASVEEVASILRSSSEAEHNAAMNGLYNKGFIFGSFERDVRCSESENQGDDGDDGDDDIDLDSDEQLAVKTKSFSRTAMLGRNEQWCYFDYFQRKKDRDGFMISKRALPAMETTPGRIVVANAKVDQLHGLNASYLVDKLPDSKGLRVVFHAWFDQKNVPVSANNKKFLRRRSDESTCSDTSTSSDSSARSSSFDFGDSTKHKAQMRRLLALAHGVTKLPDLVRRRRFGVQVPADLGAVRVQNTRCPCCTHSLAPVKLSLSMAASAIANRSLGSLKQDTRRCFLCGYLVCVDCWSAEHMESMTGRVAAIVVCTRCRANVQACEYSEVFAGTAEQRAKHRGPPRVVEDSNDNKPTVSLLIDFLSASLLNAAAGSPERAAAMAVIRTLLRQEDSDSDFDSEDDDEEEEEEEEEEEGEGEDNDDEHDEGNNDEAERMATRFKVLGELLGNEDQLPALDACKLGNGDQRNYPLDLPDDPTVDVPRSPIPSNEADRLAAGETSGLLQLADLLAPVNPPATTGLSVPKPDTHDLQLLCHLAVKTLGCAYSFVTVMCAKHEHVLAGTHPDFCGAAVPREQTTCQHALMSPHPFMAAHHEADIRFHKLGATSHVPIRFYVGFPLKVPLANSKPGDEELTVGMLCCIDSKPRAEITRTQYGTMKRLASTAKHFLLQKSRQLQLQQP